MTDPEFSTWIQRLFVCFPDVMEWLYGFEFWRQTQETWRDTLRPYTLTECLLIIDSWLTRKRPVPKRYEFGQMAIIVANSVEFDRAKDRQVNGADRDRFSFTEQSREDVLRKRSSYRPVESDCPSMGDALRQARKLMTARDKGEITESEFYKRKQELLNAL